MSRHRNVRSMRYSDEYDGYDDIYGHSVEDDYSISPSDAAFMYDRSSQQQQLSSYIRPDDIAEEDETAIKDDILSSLSDIEKAKLLSCLEEIRNVLGEAVPESNLVRIVMDAKFDATIALDNLLNTSDSKGSDKNSEAPKPQRALRQRIKGEKPRSNIKNNCKTQSKIEIKENKKNSSSQNQVFNVVEFLYSDKSSLKLDLFKGLVVTGQKSECKPDAVVVEKSSIELMPKNECIIIPEEKENMFILKHMPVEALQMVGPSKLGYFLCKKLIEVKSSSNSITDQLDFSNLKIIPFKFECKSPDDIGLSNRRWF